jgi:prevent-host-death family protein
MKQSQERYISATDFKKHFQQLINQVGAEHTSFVITKRDTPVARVSALENDIKTGISCFGIMKGNIRIKDDIINFDSNGEWELNNE